MRKRTEEEKKDFLKKIELDLKAEKMKHTFKDLIKNIL